jgi:hypothetical protein
MRHFLHDAFTLFSCDGKPLGCAMTFSALAFQIDEGGLAAQLRDERQAFTQWLENEGERRSNVESCLLTLLLKRLPVLLSHWKKGWR